MEGGFSWPTDASSSLKEIVVNENVQVVVHIVPDCPLAFVDLVLGDQPLPAILDKGKVQSRIEKNTMWEAQQLNMELWFLLCPQVFFHPE